MKNLFDFATKELSQDAFLRWLFESYEDESVNPCVHTLLRAFCGLEDDEQIFSLSTKAQWKNIDVVIHVETSKRSMRIYIEDKAFSFEHDNQLMRYNEVIARDGDVEKYKVYFKSSYLSKEEHESVKAAGWDSYDAHGICELFGVHQDSDNIILAQYIEHINEIDRALSNEGIPKEGGNERINFLKWESYFNRTIIPAMRKAMPNTIDWTACSYRGAYVYLQGMIAGREKVPYIEIRSTDCLYDDNLDGNRFVARILCYGVEDFSSQSRVLQRIESDGRLSSKGLRKVKPKQIGVTFDGIVVADDKEFIEQLRDYTEYYLELMNEWDA